MATTLSSDLEIRPDLVYGSFLETITDKFDVFNAASQGCITLNNDVLSSGFFREESFIKNFDAAFNTKRDPDSTAAVTAIKLTEGKTNEVKLFSRLGPVEWTLSALELKDVDSNYVSNAIGRQIASHVQSGLLKIGVAAVVTVLNKVTGANVTTKATETLDHKNLLKLLALRGDKSDRGRLLVFDSTAYYSRMAPSVIDGKIPGVADQLINSGNVQTAGLPYMLLDNDDLRTVASSARTEDRVLLLNPGAVEIGSGELTQRTDEPVGTDTFKVTWQGEYSSRVKVKGCEYIRGASDANKNPDLAGVRMAGRWEYRYASVHDGPGYLGKFKVA